jgi:hypothetical protein
VSRARRFPDNTCPASRHVQLIAENLIRYGRDGVMESEPKHAAESMLVVLEHLWKARSEMQQLSTHRCVLSRAATELRALAKKLRT